MTTVAVLVAVFSLAIAYLAFRRANAVERRLAETQDRLQDLSAQMAQAAEELREGLASLRLELRQRAGELAFTPDMTIAEALNVHPRVKDVLASFHLGGCSHCAVSDVDTIEGACQSYGIDQKALMQALNQLIAPQSGSSSGPIKIASMKLEL